MSPERHSVLAVLRENEGTPLSAPQLAAKAGVAASTARAYIRHAQHYSEAYPRYWPQHYPPVNEAYEKGRWVYWLGERQHQGEAGGSE
jgi:hypothetical protein